MSIDLQAAIDQGTPTQIAARLARSMSAQDLDILIATLRRVRETKSAHDTYFKFEEGAEVEWLWPTNKGTRLLRGRYTGPDESGNRIQIRDAHPATPEQGLDISRSTTCVVDPSLVELSRRLG